MASATLTVDRYARHRRRLTRPCLLVVALGLAATHCGPEPEPDGGDGHPGRSRLLDLACERPDGCVTSGSARITTGITADSVGIQLGPDAGGVTIVVPRQPVPPLQEFWAVEVLAEGSGVLTSSLVDASSADAVVHLSDGYRWRSVPSLEISAPAAERTPEVAVDLEVPDGSTARIADLRVVTIDSFGGGCSVAAGVGASGRRW